MSKFTKVLKYGFFLCLNSMLMIDPFAVSPIESTISLANSVGSTEESKKSGSKKHRQEVSLQPHAKKQPRGSGVLESKYTH